MRTILRLAAVMVALAGLIDPALARRVTAPVAVAIALPSLSDPGFGAAAQQRREIAGALDTVASVDGGAPPRAIVALGNARLPEDVAAPVLWMPLAPGSPSASIVHLDLPAEAVRGQSVPVTAAIRGRGLAGRTTTAGLELRGSVVETRVHTWTEADGSFDARFTFVPPAAGVHRLRVVVRTEAIDGTAAADAIVVTGERILQVLAYEPRPSWPLAFVRRSLEADATFAVASTSRSSRAAATTSGGAPLALGSLDIDRFDAVLVGAPDDLREADFQTLDRFVTERGGTVVLLPDRQLSDAVRRRFDLPRGEESLLETPARVDGAGGSMRASELLLMPAADERITVLGSVRQGTSVRAAVAAVTRGAGRIVISGALDAWRFRADERSGFDAMWRAIVADAALAAPRPVEVSVVPSVARPGEPLTVSVTQRDVEHGGAADVITLPAATAWLSNGDAPRELVRLWPGTRPGSYEARVTAGSPGQYTVSAAIAGHVAQAPLLVANDAVQPSRDRAAALTLAAETSGGAVVHDASALRRALATIPADVVPTRSYPMRSPWWIAPFALLLAAEWWLRRRAGLK